MSQKNSMFNSFPDVKELNEWYAQNPQNGIPNINGHIHTPHSFSAFSSIEQAFELAKKEDVSVLGINDFYTTDGYNEFAKLAKKRKGLPPFQYRVYGSSKRFTGSRCSCK